MRRLALLLGLLLCLPINLASSPSDPDGWFSIDSAPRGAAARVETATPAADGIDLSVRVPGVLTRTIETKAGPRGVLTIPEGGVTAETGHPRLPVLRTMVEVPPGATIALEIEVGSTRRVTLAELGIAAPLLPVQLPIPKLEGARELAPFTEDAAAYALNQFLPAEPVAVVDRAILRGRHVALIEFRPVRYNPAAGTVEIWSEAELKVRFEGGRAEVARREASRLASHPMDRWLTREIAGLEPSAAPAVPTEGGASTGALGMLVIVEDDYVAAIQPFLDWKKQTGYKVELLRMSEIGTNPSDSDVKAAIQSRYAIWSAPALDYLLLVGDTHVVPIHVGSGGGSSQVTDNWYACLDGSDYLPEIAVARISTRSLQETTDVVNKLMTYEQATFSSDAWVKDCGFIGTMDSGHIGLIEGTHDDCIDGYYIPNFYDATPWSYGYGACDRHYYTNNATTATISDSIDAGRSMINYSGHGGNNSWQGPTANGSYDTADVQGNTNTGMYPFVISNACVTGSLADTECFGETWQKVPSAGAIAFWGASNNSYWDEDDVLQRDTHDNIFPMDSTPPMGVLINETKLDLYDHYGNTGSVAYYFDMYNLLSEPSLSLWTREPRTLTVSHAQAAPIGQASFSVTVTNFGQPVVGALVAVLKDDEAVFEAGHTGVSGSVNLILDPAPENVGTMLVTVTGHDIDPYEGSAEIVSPDSPWLIYRSHTSDDSAGGDDDGSANPGEDLVVAVTVENVGGQPAYGVATTLTTSTPQWAEVLDGTAAYPDMESGELGTSMGDHYSIRVKPETPDGANMGFDIAWTADGDASGITSFSEMVTAVNLPLEGFTIEDFLLGNGNGVAGPGETVDLTVALANIGHKNASGISGVLSTESPYVAILQATADYSDIAAGGSGSSQPPPYSFAVDPAAPDQEPVTFTLTVTEAGSGYSNVILIDVLISSCSITSSVDVPKSILDNSTVQSELYYPHSLEIEDLDVFVDITHTYQGDLTVNLVSPTGTNVLLHDRSGGSADDIVTWYDDETTPAQPLSAFFGEDAQGTWTLIIEDHASADQGTLNDWKLELCGQGTEPVPVLTITGREVDDSAGCDPDGIADVGETVWLSLAVRNAGTAPATGLQVSISAPDRLLVKNPTVALPDLLPDEEALAYFEVLVGAVGCLEEAAFVVDMVANEGHWFDGFDLMLEADKDGESFPEDLEPTGFHPMGWTHEAAQGVDDWVVTSTRNHTPAGNWSWFSSVSASLKDNRLISPPYVLASHSSMEFWHWVDLQRGHDGGVLEISDDNGMNWTDLGPYIVVGSYDRELSGTNPLAERHAWTGSFGEWRHVVVDLSSFSGARAVRLSWRLTGDDAIASAGWWVDDVIVHSEEAVCDTSACGIPGEVQLTSLSMNSPDVRIEWVYDPLCLDFKVWRSTDPNQAASFMDVTAEDADPTDTSFLDTSSEPLLFWIIQGNGPDGPGPWGHFER